MDLDDVSFFTLDDDGRTLQPTELALSGWGADHLHGVAVSGALGREAERALAALGRDDLVPVRYTVDLFRAARRTGCTLSSAVVREGPRLALIDVQLTQDDVPVARATTLFLKPTASSAGETWEPSERPVPPPLDVAPPGDGPRVPYLHSSAGWSQRFSDHQNPSRKTSWNSPVPVVRGERLTPWQSVAGIADGGSLVTNWGTHGVEYINADITLALSRPPSGVEIGLQALDRVERDGIAVGTVSVFDREGPLGTIVLTSLANQHRSVDVGSTDYDDDGTRHPVAQA